MMPQTHTVEIILNGRTLSIETGRVAEQAGGAVICRYGETVLLATATSSAAPREGIDFLPLTVDVEERLYAAGKIPGGFIKREGRPTEHSILASRLVDRPIRPLFPKGYRNDVQVVITVLSVDMENDADILGVVGASAALSISDVPWAGPVGAVRVGYIDGQIVVNPLASQMAESALDLALAGTEDAVVMVEAGAKELPEETMVEAIKQGHEVIKQLCQLQQQLVSQAGKPKRSFMAPAPDAELEQAVATFVSSRFPGAFGQKTKAERETAVAEIQRAMLDELGPKWPDKLKELGNAFDKEEKKFVRQQILEKGIRPDGRGPTDIRPIWCQVGVLPRPHGSAIFTRGQTQVLSIVTLGSPGEEQMLDGLGLEESKRYIHHYNFPSFSVGETRPSRGPGRREIGHGALAERALLPVLPSKEEFPYTIRVVSEVLSSNGSTSMGSTCGSTLALMDAGVPLRAPVAGVAMGLITASGETLDKYAILSDIQGLEDAMGDMDFKVAGTADGITALQMDIKIKGLTPEVLAQAMAQAKVGRMFIMDRMLDTLGEPREQLSPYAPQIQSVRINTDKIGLVIGPGGKTIRRIQDESGAKIDIDDDGTVHISATSGEGMQRAMEAIRALTEEVELGKIYTGVVRRLVDFGAFVEVLPGKEGLVRLSQLADYPVTRPEDVVAVGDEITVMVIEVDPQGRVNLSRKAALSGEMPSADELEAERATRGRGPGGPRGFGGGGGGGYGGPRGGGYGGQRGGPGGGPGGPRGGPPQGGRGRPGRPY
ncbi:MAG TPA: polyribonucleotide nucleotidyltransferase [Ktedonobacterales bacterium]|nr:polyribonucleotide nucleotidyltransferase [Ktedonobacterales bacterium]